MKFRALKRIVLVSLATAACSSEISAICQSQADCEGWNDADVDACIASTKGEQNSADAYGCKENFDSLLQCVSDGASCSTEEGKSRWTISSKCSSEGDAYQKCLGSASSRID